LGSHFVDPAERVQVAAVASLSTQWIDACIAMGKRLRQARKDFVPDRELRAPIGNCIQLRQRGGM
jgi:hypothetical protein